MFDSNAFWWLGCALVLASAASGQESRAGLRLAALACVGAWAAAAVSATAGVGPLAIGVAGASLVIGLSRWTTRRRRRTRAVARVRVTFAYQRDVVRECVSACASRGALVDAIEVGQRDARSHHDALATIVLEIRGADDVAGVAADLREIADVREVLVEPQPVAA